MNLSVSPSIAANFAAKRPIYAIARDIRKAWGAKVNFAAKPYLDAMASLDGPDDSYDRDSAQSVVVYFLGNANSFRGDAAKALKAELKSLFPAIYKK